MSKPHLIFQAIQEIAEETYHSYGDATPDDWHDCVIFGVESFVYGLDNYTGWTFVSALEACGVPLPVEVEWTVRGPGGGYPTEIRNVAEYARDEYDGDEAEFLNVSYRRGYDGSFHPGLGNMMVSALERKALEVCTLPVPPAPVEVATAHTFNTGNPYGPNGQVIVAVQFTDGTIAFKDLTRHIDGVLTCPSEDGPCEFDALTPAQLERRVVASYMEAYPGSETGYIVDDERRLLLRGAVKAARATL